MKNEKCAFCAYEVDEDGKFEGYPDYHESLIDETVHYQTTVKISVKHEMCHSVNNKEFELLCPDIDLNAGMPYQMVYINGYDRTLRSCIVDLDGFNAFEYKKKINYCPMCGRKFKED